MSGACIKINFRKTEMMEECSEKFGKINKKRSSNTSATKIKLSVLKVIILRTVAVIIARTVAVVIVRTIAGRTKITVFRHF